jgi:rRNA-processing protein FCF1
MLHVVVDTTVLRSDPGRKKAAFQSLMRLSQARVVQVYIPYVVQQEFLSQEREKNQAHLKKVISSIQSLQRIPLPEAIVSFLKDSIESFEQIQLKLDDFPNQAFQAWCDETQTEILPIDISHGKKVVDSYFRGNPPFKKQKNREDFPDAFIWQAILDLSENLEELYVITNDNIVNDALQKQEKAIPVRNLDKFIELEVCQKAIQELELKESKESNWADNFQRIIELLEPNKLVLIDSIESELLNKLIGNKVESFEILDDNHEASIDHVENISNLRLYIEKISYYGSSTFVLPVSVELEAQLSYFIYKANYWALDDDGKGNHMSIGDWNDHYYSVDEAYALAIEGRISITLNSEALERSGLSDEDLIEVIENSQVSVDSLDDVSVIS